MRGSLQQRSKGSWRIRYDGPPDGNGKRKQVSETVQGTKTDAQRVLRERLGALETGTYVDNNKETVAQFLRRWLDSHPKLRASSKQSYHYKIESCVIPALGGLRLQKIRPGHIQKFYNDLLGQGFSPTTVHNVHAIFSSALSTAVRWGDLVRNPCTAVIVPSATRQPFPMWTVDQLQQFLYFCAGGKYRDWYELSIYAGLRRSELSGLKWDRVDFETSHIRVVETLQRIIGQGLIAGEPKNAGSSRAVAFGPMAKDLLLRVRAHQSEQRVAAGDLWTETGYVFTQPSGYPIDPALVTEDFRRNVKKSGLPRLTLRDLRHANATLLIDTGIHLKVMSERLGHSSIRVTADIYSHVLPSMEEAAAYKVEEALWSRNGHELPSTSQQQTDYGDGFVANSTDSEDTP